MRLFFCIYSLHSSRNAVYIFNLRLGKGVYLMRPVCNILLFSLIFALSGCACSRLAVYDFTTREPVANAFVYVYEHKMFYPFNGASIYLTDERGNVDISESLKDGQVSVFVGKDGYDLNLFTRNFERQETPQLFIKKTATPKIKELHVRKSPTANGGKNDLLDNFYEYCAKQKIELKCKY